MTLAPAARVLDTPETHIGDNPVAAAPVTHDLNTPVTTATPSCDCLGLVISVVI